MSDHVHRYNGTMIRGHGRCSCGAWARYDRKTRSYGAPFGETYTKGLETRVRRYQDHSIPYPHADVVAEDLLARESEPDPREK